MPGTNKFKTKIRLDNSKVYQYNTDNLDLSGDTTLYGSFTIDTEGGGGLKVQGVPDPENKYLRLNDQGDVEFDIIDGLGGHNLENNPAYLTPLTGDRRSDLRGLGGIVFANPGTLDYTTISINKNLELTLLPTENDIVSDGFTTYNREIFLYTYKDYSGITRELRFYYVDDVLLKKQYRDQLIHGNNIIEESYVYDSNNILTDINYNYNLTEWIGE